MSPPFTGIADVFYGDADNVRRRGLTLKQAVLDAQEDDSRSC